jgi:hypothetical protein
MSKVTDVHSSSGDTSEHEALRPGDLAGEELSGYLCGLCEEPLPNGASACPACGTPVAPLEDDEMVAGPYVISDDPDADPYATSDEAGTRDAAASTATRRAPEDPVDVLGIDRPDYPSTPVGDTGPDPMLGRAPTAPVLPPPPRQRAPRESSPAPAPATETERRKSGSRGSSLPLAIGAVLVVGALGAAAAALATRDSSDGSTTSTPPTTAARPAPPPSTASTVSASSSPSLSVAPSIPRPTAGEPPSLDLFCVAAVQFKVDSNTESIANKFFNNPSGMVSLFEALAYNAPGEYRARLTSMRDSVKVINDRITSGELRSAADVKIALDAMNQSPTFDQVIVPAVMRYCPRFAE